MWPLKNKKESHHEVITIWQKFSQQAGIISLMEDLGNALADGNMIMMGVGIPDLCQRLSRHCVRRYTKSRKMRRHFGVWLVLRDPPQGEKASSKRWPDSLNEKLGWLVGRNILHPRMAASRPFHALSTCSPETLRTV